MSKMHVIYSIVKPPPLGYHLIILPNFGWALSGRWHYIFLQNVLITLGTHFAIDDSKLSRP